MSPAAWAWIVLPLAVAAAVVGFDFWAQTTGRLTMSAQIHLWMQDQLIGPLVVGGLVGAGAGLIYHFAINR